MNCRRHGSKPTIALWMLVAIADFAILTAATGPLMMILIVAGLVVLGGGVVAARAFLRRSAHATKPVVRRRA